MHGVVVVEDRDPGSGGAPMPLAVDAQVANRPIADHVLESLAEAGMRHVVVASSERMADRVRECVEQAPAGAGLDVAFVRRRGPVGLASALALAAPLIDGSPCVVHTAGGLLAEPLQPLTRELRRDVDAVLLVHRARRDPSSPAGELSPLSPDPGRLDGDLAVSGVCALGAAALGEAVGRADNDELDLTTLAARIRAAGGNVDIRLTDGWRPYRGDAAELLELNRMALDRIAPPPPSAHPQTRVEGRVLIHPEAYVSGSVIVGPTVIGRDACVRDSYIGPFSSIGDRAWVEGSEIERSIVEPGARIAHVGQRIGDSVIGAGARVARDFELPRSVRLRVGPGAEVGLC